MFAFRCRPAVWAFLLSICSGVVLASQAFGDDVPIGSGNSTDNVLVNGGFATGLTAWGWDDRYQQGAGPDPSWSPVDASGSLTSGSAQLTSTDRYRAKQLLQCVDLAQGQVYEFGAKAYFPPGQSTRGEALLAWVEYASSDCSGPYTGFGVLQRLDSDSNGVWQPLSAKPPLGVNAGSMQVIIASLSSSAQAFSVNFDDAFVRLLPATVVASALPEAMVQEAGRAGATTSYTLTNIGEVRTTISLDQQGSFFYQTPSTVVLEPHGSKTIEIAAFAQAAGSYSGSSLPRGDGAPLGMAIPVRLAVLASTASSTATPTENRIDLSASESVETLEASAVFFNPGQTPLQGIATSDVPWILAPGELITIPPGGSTSVTFQVDRSARTSEERLVGSITGTLALSFLADDQSRFSRGPTDGPVSTSSGSTVKDSRFGVAAPVEISQLEDSEIVLFVPGVGHVTGGAGKFISDVSIVASRIVLGSVLDVIYAPSDAQATALKLTHNLIPGKMLNLADVVQSYYQETGNGTLLLRTVFPGQYGIEDTPDPITASAIVFNTSNAAGTFGSAIPVFRSDRSVAIGDRTYLTGLAGGTRTNLLLQETSGYPTHVDILLLDASGDEIGTIQKDLEPFRLLRTNDFASGAASAVLTNRIDSKGRFVAFATPVDDARELDGSLKGGDTWVVANWPEVLGYAPDEPVIIPIAGAIPGANNTYYRTDLSIMNTSDFPATGRLTFVSNGNAPVERVIELGRYESQSYENVVATLFGIESAIGYLTFTPLSPFSARWLLTGRIYATEGDQVATFGTGVPALSLESAMKVGETCRFTGFDDTGYKTMVAGTPATFRSNLGLVETSGAPVRVRVTLHNLIPEDLTVIAAENASKEYDLLPDQLLMVLRIANDILGDRREKFREDLPDLYLDVEVVHGEGSVIAFISSIDNGTADQVLKTP